MKSANVSTQDRANGALLVLGHLVNIVGLANTKVSGQYIFAGTNTNTIPYTLDDETNPTTATYAGNSDAFTVKTGKNITVEVGHDGQAVFDNTMTALIDLKGYLETDDIAGIGTILDTLETEFQNINSEIARIGAKDLRFDTREKIISDLELGYTEKQSELEDIDIIEALSDLQSTELAYKAALSSSAKIMELSLVDFL
jgi:flagellar hook-associated protein 3 FlgL